MGGGNNVPNRTTSDLWLADGFGYTGTWGGTGHAVFVWQLDGTGAPVLHDSIITANIGTVSDIQVSEDGGWLVFTAEGGPGAGLYVYELTSPGTPVFRAKQIVSAGLHTGTLADIGGKLYAFTRRTPNCPQDFDLSQPQPEQSPSSSTRPDTTSTIPSCAMATRSCSPELRAKMMRPVPMVVPHPGPAQSHPGLRRGKPHCGSESQWGEAIPLSGRRGRSAATPQGTSTWWTSPTLPHRSRSILPYFGRRNPQFLG